MRVLRRYLPTVVFLAVCGISTNARTQTPAKELCADAKTQLEINECFGAAYKAADKELNAFYKSLSAKFIDKDLENLKAAQRAWIQYRDANCEAETALYEGGSIQPAIRGACLERVTRARIAELHAVYDTGDR
jgi:uncharacterized protein YecT (DUF1311 family)